MIANSLPGCLYQPNGNSVSVERILRTAKELIEKYGPISGEADDVEVDLVTINLDDLETLIRNIT